MRYHVLTKYLRIVCPNIKFNVQIILYQLFLPLAYKDILEYYYRAYSNKIMAHILNYLIFQK